MEDRPGTSIIVGLLEDSLQDRKADMDNFQELSFHSGFPRDATETSGMEKNKSVLKINTSLLKTVPLEQEMSEIQELGLDVYNQDDLERGIMDQVDQAIAKQEKMQLKKMAEKEMKAILDEKRLINKELVNLEKAIAENVRKAEIGDSQTLKDFISLKQKKENKLKQLKRIQFKEEALIKDVYITGKEPTSDEGAIVEDYANNKSLASYAKNKKESENEKLIKTGLMTPFGTILQGESLENKMMVTKDSLSSLSSIEKYLLTQKHFSQTKKANEKQLKSKLCNNKEEESPFTQKQKVSLILPKLKKKKKKHKNISISSGISEKEPRRNVHLKVSHSFDSDSEISEFEKDDSGDNDEYIPDERELKNSWYDEDDEFEIERDSDVDRRIQSAMRLKGKGKRSKLSDAEDNLDGIKKKKIKASKQKKLVDDSYEDQYLQRLREFKKEELWKKRLKYENDEIAEEENMVFDCCFIIPGNIWKKLYGYQKTGVRWLWELHSQEVGGIMGDEMGLGKTIQIIAFFIGLSYSKLSSKSLKFQGLGSTIIVCPATVMYQWLKEFRTWWPLFRVAILHESGSYSGHKDTLIRNINTSNGILITSYSGLTNHQKELTKLDWHYIVLDEGHKIRNPDAQVTLAAKQFRTPHRIILSGSPIQNSLKELWSLFDFIFPGKLATLPVFMQQFSVPIVQGGYANATQVQVQTSVKCAIVLRNTISPYLIRRLKSDVKMSLDLPEKNEQVLFCRLTDEQIHVYKDYLGSDQIMKIMDGRIKIFVGLINLRKICNHPDLFTGRPKIFENSDSDFSQSSEAMEYGFWKRSGKMIVVETLLKLWKKQNHKVLLFSQGTQMLDILEKFVQINNYTYLRMDGSSTIGSRQTTISIFNSNPDIFIFLLTTRVGGLGVNLTGANRIIIFDPDWNPSTDMQARERAWRIGQTKEVCIYRLLTTGTIEEKIYHRQIFKQFLTNRVLKDPKQRRFFKANDLHELFILTTDNKQDTETSALFAGSGYEVKTGSKQTKKLSIKVSHKKKVKLSEKKLLKIREIAKELSRKIEENKDRTINSSNKEVDKSIHILDSKKESYTTFGNDRKVQKLQSRKKKRHKDSKFEGIHVAYLDRKSAFKHGDAEQKEKNVNKEEYILQKLFKTSGVHSALNHDAIMKSSNPDYLIVEAEAEKVAKEAVKVLKESHRQCLNAVYGVPTWTGQNGISGAPGIKPRFGQKKRNVGLIFESNSNKDSKDQLQLEMTSNKMFSGAALIEEASNENNAPSSCNLLAKIKERNLLTVPNDDPTVAGILQVTPEHNDLLSDIRSFIAFQALVNGQATTDEILQHFKSKLPSKDSPVFKAMLNQICIFERNISGTGIWKLKAEFK